MNTNLFEKLVDWVRHSYFGKYRGTVVDNADPTERARLKVRVPSVLGEAEVWARPCVSYVGDNVGLRLLPEPDTGVWVEFEGGDPTHPLWSGVFCADNPLRGGAAGEVLRGASIAVVLDDDIPERHAFIEDAGDVIAGDEV